MSPIFTSLVALAAAVTGVSALPQTYALPAIGDTVPRGPPENTPGFSLFAFGSSVNTSIGGFPLFYNNGVAYIADPSKVNYTADYVVLTLNDTDLTSWIVNPIFATESTASDWANATFYVSTAASSGAVGFYKEGSAGTTASGLGLDDIITTGFRFYGNAAVVEIDGSLETLWYALKTTIDGLWTVGWNPENVADAEMLTLKRIRAPNVSFPWDSLIATTLPAEA